MAWDSTRQIPWQRLIRDWLIYVGIMCVVFLIVFRDRLSTGPFVGLFVSGPLYLGVGAVLAKFGYQRKTLKDLRTETTAKQVAQAAAPQRSAATGRTKPPPTKRTSTGTSNRPNKAKRR